MLNEKQDDDSILKPSLMAAHLGRLQRQHLLVSISISGTSNIYNSMLVNVDTENHTMLLDILHPELAHQQLMKKKKFIFNVTHEGVKISFKGTIKKLVEDEGKPAYLIEFPEKLIYQQRRQYFRAPICKDTILPITLTNTETNSRCEGIINNVSRGGICMQFDHNVNFKFDKFEILSAHFHTNENIEITCNVEIRNVTSDSVHRHQLVGAKFKDLTKLQKRHIQNFSLSIERRMLKQRA